ncbi:amidohydrolase [Ornithinimicrobium pratense]|uniref:Amidohydrolase n=1 Tax=Ornithinimicrobium pratense TaxID=2593973 RepID=A0A5J6V2D7_9MICO|nr:amidohydrolase [Ornithinimicrobium pratense]QFG67875.1 amidohydrolase [Ornithinimicrobium pratense]
MTAAQSLISEELRAQLEADYRHLHAHPELSMQEHRTAGFIEGRLSELGVEHFRCGGTGVVAVLRNGDGPTLAYRADTDGLPIAEETGLEWSSEATGRLPDGTEVPVMHGCGHDTHVAVALALTRALLEHRDEWAGTVVLVFQPGEETAAGAAAMVADGLWDRAPRAEAVYGQHVMAHLAGTIRLPVGTAMAMADSWQITLRGRQAHGSQPHNSIDPIVLGSHLVTRLQSVVSRTVNPRDVAVVTVGTFHAGTKENIIPQTAVLGLNMRAFTDQVRDTVLAGIRRTVEGEVLASGAPEAQIEELYRFPACVNDPEESERVLQVLRAELGEDQVKVVEPVTGSEDVGVLASAIGAPLVYWFNGGHPREVLEGDQPVPGNHSPHFAPVAQPTLDTGLRAALAVLLSRVGH